MRIEPSAGGQLDLFWGQSVESYETAIKAAVGAARKAHPDRTLAWFEVVEFRGGFEDGDVQFQTTIRVGLS